MIVESSGAGREFKFGIGFPDRFAAFRISSSRWICASIGRFAFALNEFAELKLALAEFGKLPFCKFRFGPVFTAIVLVLLSVDPQPVNSNTKKTVKPPDVRPALTFPAARSDLILLRAIRFQ